MDMDIRRQIGLFALGASLTIVASLVESAADDSVAFIPREAFCAISLNLKAVREIEGGEFFPYEYTDVYVAEEYSFAPSSLDRVTWIFAADEKTTPEFSAGVILHMAKPIDLRRHIAERSEIEPDEVVVHQVDDLTIYESDELYSYFAIQMDSKTVLLSHSEPIVLLMAATKNAGTDLTKALRQGDSVPDFAMVLTTNRLRHVVDEPIRQSPLPSEIKDLPAQIKVCTVFGKFDGVKLKIKAEVTADKTQAARNVEDGIKESLRYGEKAMADLIKSQREVLDDDGLISFRYIHRLIRIAKRDIEWERKGKVVSFEYEFKNFLNLGWGMVILFAS